MRCPPFVICFVTILLASPWAARAQERDSARLAQAIAPMIDDQTLVVAHISLGDLDAAAALDRLAEILKLSEPNRQGFSVARAVLVDSAAVLKKAGARDLFLVSSIADLPAMPFVFAVPMEQGMDAVPIVARLGMPQAHGAQGATSDRLGNLLLIGGKGAIERMKSMTPAVRPEVAAAFESAAGASAQVLVLPPADARRVIEEVMPNLPKKLGGGASRAFAQGIVWAAAGLDLPPKKLAARLTIQSANAQTAATLNVEIEKMLQAVAQLRASQQQVPKVADLAKVLKPTVSGDRLSLDLGEGDGGLAALASLVAQPVEAARTRARRAVSTNNLKQIMLAIYNYYDANKRFPPRASFSADGKPLLSWRVQLLPYLDSNQLYKEFKLDEPWDSEHNRKLIERMPDVLHSPLSAAATGHTTYLAPVLPGGIFGGRDTLDIREIIDGTSHTIMVVDADDGHSVVWSKPDDIEIDLADPLKGLRNPAVGGFNVGLADGSAHFVPNTAEARVAKALFTATGKEIVEWPR